MATLISVKKSSKAVKNKHRSIVFFWGGGDRSDIEDSSWDRVQDKDIFSRRLTGRPSDEGARSARNAQGKDILTYFARGYLKNSISFNLRLIAPPH